MGIEKHRNSVEKDLRRYMLGELTELEQQAYEGRLLSEDEMFREVEELAEVVQDEVVEDYLAGELSEPQRRAFERYQLICPNIHEMRLVQEALRTASRLGLQDVARRARAVADREPGLRRPLPSPGP